MTESTRDSRVSRTNPSAGSGGNISSAGRLRRAGIAVLVAVALSFARPASAQEAERIAQPLPAPELEGDPPASELRVLPADPCTRLTLVLSELDAQDARASCLAGVRLANRQDRIDEGVVLLGFGLLSAIAGGVTAGIGAGDGNDLLVSVGVGTAGWGAINAALSFALFDLEGAALREIEDDRSLTSEALLRARDRTAAAQDQTAMILAVNAGIDVFYVATGVFLAVLGQQAEPQDRGLFGYGLAMAAQGAFLLAYDGVTWAFAAERAGRLRALLADPSTQ